MQFMPLAGLYWKQAGAGSIRSGIYYTTQPTDIPMFAKAVEKDLKGYESVYEFVRISGTCTVGALLYRTGVDGYVVCTGTGAGKTIRSFR